MKTHNSHSCGIAALAVLLLAALPAQAAPRAAQRSTPVLQQLHFAIEAENRAGVDPLIVGPGEGFRIQPGQRLVIRAVGNARTNERMFPEVRYFVVAGADSIALADARQKMGTVAVDALSSSRGQNAVIGYQILGNTVLDGVARDGRLEVQVDGPGGNSRIGALGTSAWPGDFNRNTANTMVRDLYRGILLREPDDSAVSWLDRIERGGYLGLVEVAQAIAVSEESRVDVYQRAGSNEQRLAALYRHLLGREPSQVARSAWDRGLQLLSDRHYSELVTELLGQPEFFDRYRLPRPERRF